MISNDTRTAHWLEHRNGVALVEITRDDGTFVPNRFYVVEWDPKAWQVMTIRPEDLPEGGGRFVSRGQSAAAVAYVASGRSHSTARRSYRKLVCGG